ncbi:MAG: hypothetical protein IJD23_07365 [Spirochaetaceae bacterium]|nr:hypothetical protein [Spirochaetaceae bacterium]
MKKIYLVLFVILSIFVFSCKDNLISSDLSSSQNSGVGQVKVFVKQSRLIGPDVSDVDWTVELYKENDKFSGKNENGYYLFSGLSDGTYNIKVSGKIDEVEKFTGSAITTITNGNSVSVNVPIVAKKTDKESGDDAEKKGYATITMDMSEELLSKMGVKFFLHAELVGSDDKVYIASFVDEENQIFLDNQQITFAYTDYSSQIPTTDIPAGYYNLSFVGLEDFGYSIKLKDNLVEIGDGLTTNIVLTQNDYELVEVLSESDIFYVDNSDNEIDDSSTFGTSLSKPLGFRNINDFTSAGDILYLISDVNTYVNTYVNAESSISYISGRTITSFGSDIFSIINNISDRFVSLYSTTLKNIKLTNTTGNGFILSDSTIDGTVILDTPIVQDSNANSTVLMSKSSNLVIGQKFSGELGICLSSENWQLGDTVVTFENGKPNNANFYISESYDSQGNSLASKFYIDDKGKLAQYDANTQWVNFAWGDEKPYLITQTQAKNKTYTRIIDSNGNDLNGFNGISTYDEENQTWFIANGSDSSGNAVSSLYKVSAPTEYTDSVEPEKIEVSIPNLPTVVNLSSVTAMDYDNGKLYMGFYDADCLNLCVIETSNSIGYLTSAEFNQVSNLTALLVDRDNVYMATKNPSSDNSGITHSAIWKYTLSEDTSGNGVYYHLIPAESYVSEGVKYPVPYYLTQYDDNLTIDTSFPKNSTFRITDLYIDGTEVYGLLANYEDKQHISGTNSFGAVDVYMRGSVFKLVENSSRDDNTSDPIMNANHLGLRKSFPLTSENLATAKQYFILPRKIVGILNKKLVIVDDGMVPDSNDCNVDRFVLFDLFDLADEISETIDVAVPFSTNGFATTSSPMTFYTINSLFN